MTFFARSLCKHWVGTSAAMPDDFEVGGENEMGVFRRTLTVLTQKTQSSRRARRAFEVKKYINCHLFLENDDCFAR